jgi:hypothetical protein
MAITKEQIKAKVVEIIAAHDAIRGPYDKTQGPHDNLELLAVGRESFSAYLTEVFTQAESVPALVARIEKLEAK